MSQLVCLDSNAWFKERLLRSSVGAAFLLSLEQNGSKLLLPAVVKREIEELVMGECEELRKSVDKDLSFFQSLTGSKPDIKWLPNEILIQSITERFTQLAKIIFNAAYDTAMLERALTRVITHLPPAHFTEQFRDCLVWGKVLEHAHSNDLVLITNDNAFYGAGNDLHPQLQEEISSQKLPIKIYRTIDSFLEFSPRVDLKTDLQMVTRILDSSLTSIIENSLSGLQITPTEITSPNVRLFATEDPRQLAVSFDVTYAGLEPENVSLTGNLVSIQVQSGSCTYDRDNSLVKNIQTPSIITFSADGHEINRAMTMYTEGLSLGSRMIPYRVRRELK